VIKQKAANNISRQGKLKISLVISFLRLVRAYPAEPDRAEPGRERGLGLTEFPLQWSEADGYDRRSAPTLVRLLWKDYISIDPSTKDYQRKYI